VPEYYTVKRTCYRTECRTETYNTCRTECVPEWREQVCCVVKRVPVVREECRKVCKMVQTCEERTVMKTCYKTVQETVMQKQLVRLGHWECYETCHKPLLGGHGNGGGLLGGLCHKNNCNDPCADNCGQCANTCTTYKTRTHRRWVHCPEYRCCPKTVCKRVCVQVPTVCKVNVCRPVWTEQRVKVCTYQCVTERQVKKVCVMVRRQVPCQATRTVRVCVPYQVDVKCCRMVPRQVQREVPCAPATNCAPANACCEQTTCCQTRNRCFSGLRNRGGRGCGHHNRNADCCR
jgi:hypothetical protein